jgi:hypothetical protein
LTDTAYDDAQRMIAQRHPALHTLYTTMYGYKEEVQQRSPGADLDGYPELQKAREEARRATAKGI